jgi:hypothetical protein
VAHHIVDRVGIQINVRINVIISNGRGGYASPAAVAIHANTITTNGPLPGL